MDYLLCMGNEEPVLLILDTPWCWFYLYTVAGVLTTDVVYTGLIAYCSARSFLILESLLLGLFI